MSPADEAPLAHYRFCRYVDHGFGRPWVFGPGPTRITTHARALALFERYARRVGGAVLQRTPVLGPSLTVSAQPATQVADTPPRRLSSTLG